MSLTVVRQRLPSLAVHASSARLFGGMLGGSRGVRGSETVSRSRFRECQNTSSFGEKFPESGKKVCFASQVTECQGREGIPTLPHIKHSAHPHSRMEKVEFKARREGGDEGGEARLDDDSFRCVLEALGYSEDLAMCACLNKSTFRVAKDLMSEARKKAVEASRHALPIVDEKVYNRALLGHVNEEDAVGPQQATWIVEGKPDNSGTRVVRMKNCEEFARKNFPAKTVAALSDHLPLFRVDAPESLRLASSTADVPDDLHSPDFRLIPIRARMLTYDRALHISVSGVVFANVNLGIDMSEFFGEGPFLGRVRCHACHVHWTSFRAHIVD